MNAAQDEIVMLRSALSNAKQARDEAVRDLDTLRLETRRQVIETQHRLRNTVSTIRAIVHRTAEETDDVPEYCGLLDGRLAAYLNVQIAVAAGIGTGVDLELLIRDELLKFGIADQDRCDINGPTLKLGHRAAGLVALMIYELVLQLVVRGFEWSRSRLTATWTMPSDSEGNVVFLWSVGAEHIDRTAAQCWLDSVRGAIEHQLSGQFLDENHDDIIATRVILPVKNLIA